MKHLESKIQQQCVAWFRAQYPQYAMLLVHPINEGSGHTDLDRRRQGIHKAEGAVAGVADLLFFMPACNHHGLGIELKAKTGRQSQDQKYWQQIFEAAGYKYCVARDFDTFRRLINDWVASASVSRRQKISMAHVDIVRDREDREKKSFYKIVNKK